MFHASPRYLGEFQDGRAIYALAVSPDARLLAIAGDGLQIEVLDLQAARLVSTYGRHEIESIVASLAWSPDGRYIASGGYDGTVQVWNAITAEPAYVCRQRSLSSRVLSLAWSPDGSTLASAVSDGTITLYDAPTGVHLRTLSAQGAVLSVAWSPDSLHVVSGGQDGTLSIWPSHFLSRPIFTHTPSSCGAITAVRWFPSSGQVIFLQDTLDSHLLHLFDTRRRETIWMRPEHLFQADVQDTARQVAHEVGDLAVSGNFLASVGGSGIPVLWDRDGTRLAELPHVQDVRALAFCPALLSAGTLSLLTGSWDGQVLAWPLFFSI